MIVNELKIYHKIKNKRVLTVNKKSCKRREKVTKKNLQNFLGN